MSKCKLDHLVVVAADLKVGQEYIEALLDVETVPGGKHRAMGTHNRLLRLGEDQYLEIIAIDPDGNAPERPRWFGMDDVETHSRVRDVPRLAAWVARTHDIDWAAERPPYNAMNVRDMSRDDLRWRMTFTSDGSLPLEGALPLLIEWKTQPIPPLRLPDNGCALKRLVVQSPQDQRVRRVLQELGLDGIDVDHSVQAGLTATLTTPGGGEVVLSGATAREPGKRPLSSTSIRGETNVTEVRIRKASEEDAPQLIQFNCAMARETEDLVLDQDVVTAGVRMLFDQPERGFYIVADTRERLAGSLMITNEWSDWRNGTIWWIQSVYVRPEYRRRGVYRSLYEFVRVMATETKQVCGFRLYVERENYRAQKTYESLGMEKTPYLVYESFLRDKSDRR